MLKTALKIALFTLYALIIIGSVFCAFVFTPYRVPAVIVSILLVILPIAVLMLRRRLIQKKEKAFIDRVINVDKETISKSTGSQQTELLELQQSWKESINRLRTSRLRKIGNPLYALPWYLVIGESRTGKSSMICHSGLSSPLAKTVSSTLSVTRNCEWWFFNEAIVLDTAGRYTIPIDPQRDMTEWDEFLKLLSRFRRKEPINGIVAAISSEKLLSMSPSELAEQGSLVRSRIDQVMRSLGAQFPIYIMITKMDLVFGMPEFFRSLPRSRLGQAMGWCNSAHAPYSDQLLESALHTINNDLRILQSRLLHGTGTPEAEVLIFPKKFLELLPGLRRFCSSVFSDSVYQITPRFRGIYCSSALQKIEQGDRDGEISEQALSGGMFLREFFSKILPGDRKQFRFIPEYAVNNVIDRKSFRYAWAGIWGVLTLFAWFGYNRNQSALRSLSLTRMDTQTNPVMYMEQVRLSVHNLHKQNSQIFPLRLGMSQSRAVEKHIREFYAGTFEQNVHSRIATSISGSVQNISPAASEDTVMAAVHYLTALLGLTLQSSKVDRNFHEYLTASQDFLPMVLSRLSQKDAAMLMYQYRDWIAWSERNTVENFRKFIYDRLTLLMEKKGADLRWCIRYPLHGINALSMRDFWHAAAVPVVVSDKTAKIDTRQLRVRKSPSINAEVVCLADSGQTFRIDSVQPPWIRIVMPSGSFGWVQSGYASVLDISDTVQVGGAFTSEGFRHVQEFLNHIDSMVSDSTVKISFGFQKNGFYQWYWENYYRQWYTMMDRFIDGFNSSANQGSLRSYMKSVTVNDDPFMHFIGRMAKELDGADMQYVHPVWLDQVLLLRDTERALQAKISDSVTTGLAKTGKRISGFFRKIESEAKEVTDQATVMRNRKIESSIESWDDYRRSVALLYKAGLQPGGMVSLAQSLFSTQDTGSETYLAVLDAAQALRVKLFDNRVDEAVWNMLEGPLKIITRLAYTEAHAEVQRLWDMVVLSKLNRSDPEMQVDVLFARDSGLVHKFILEPYIAAFLVSAPDGSIRLVEGPEGPLGFTPEFIAFINNGIRYSVKREYPLYIKTVPFSVNAEASEEPYQTILRLQCAEGASTLENYNHYETADFVYRPESCGEVTLKVVFPSCTVVKTWGGRWGFPNFLKTFRDGVNVIRSEDFDVQYRGRLQRKNISYVRITYELDPLVAAEVIKLLEFVPRHIPTKICTSIQEQ